VNATPVSNGERGPPADDPRQDPSRADPIAHQPVGISKQRVGEIKRAEHIAHWVGLRLRSRADVGPGDRDRDPIEIRDTLERHRHRQDFVADMGVSERGALERAGRTVEAPVSMSAVKKGSMSDRGPGRE